MSPFRLAQGVLPVSAAHRLLVVFMRLGAVLLLTPVVSTSYAQDLRVDSKVQVSPVDGGWYPWYQLAAGPDDPNHLIVCGSRWDVRDNAFYGFVYSSSDGGRTWQPALEDKSTTWVTEQSCAFGVGGKAFLLSEASRVVDGRPNHKLGTTRVFSSADAGRSWVVAARTHWADFSASVVNTRPGPNQNRLYSFFHDFEPYPSEKTDRQSGGEASRISVISFKEGGTQVDGPIRNPAMDSLNYRGAYPGTVLLLKDGALLAIFMAALKTNRGWDDTINAVRLEGKRLTDPVTLVRAATTTDGCYPSHLAATYDSVTQTVYVAYPAKTGEACGLVLRTSGDGGRTWAAEEHVLVPGDNGAGVFMPAMAFSNAGVLGLIWRGNRIADCWYFSASRDGGKTFSRALPLSQCLAEETFPDGRSASLRMSVRASAAESQSALPPDPQDVLLSVVDSRNAVWRNTGALVATLDGVFHALWAENGRGEGQLRSARLILAPFPKPEHSRLEMTERDSRNITPNVAVLYGGDQHYDTQTNTLTLDIVLKNTGTTPVRGALFLKVLALTGEIGRLEIANASNQVTGPGATWDLSDTLPNGVLQPGTATRPYSLVFRLLEKSAPAREFEVISLRFQVWGLGRAAPRVN